MATDAGSQESLLSAFKVPDSPIIAAGALGGPSCIYASTPIRNALTIAAGNTSFTIGGCYKQAFSAGFTRAFSGGQYYAIAACPQFVCLGPIYHAYASVFGAAGGVALTGITETLIVHGAEKKNAQMSVNNMKEGRIPLNRIQSAYSPFGAGFGLHITRNISAMIGMRVLCHPITKAYERITGPDSTAAVLAGDFSANIVSACISMPLHQLWNYTVSTPEMWDKPRGDRAQMMIQYLRSQYLTTTASGATTLSSVILRDAFLRSAYIATIYTAFVNLERGFVKYWPW